MKKSSALADWTPEQIALLGKRWVETWRLAGQDLERFRRKEARTRHLQAISLLCGPADYTKPPYAPKPWSGLIEQQRLFMKAAGREPNSSGPTDPDD